MAACTLGGALSVKAPSHCLNSKKAIFTSHNLNKYGCQETFGMIRLSYVRQERVFYSSTLGQPHRSTSSFSVKSSSAQTENKPGDVSEEKKSFKLMNQLVPSSEVESLLTSICDTASIAEFKLDLGGFHLYVKRDLGGNDLDYVSQITPPVYTETSTQLPDSNGSVKTSLAFSQPEFSAGGIQGFLKTAIDEGLVIIKSPKVGVFRRSRTIKGKLMPPPCKEKQEVKKGKVLCFIEHFGRQIPVESDVAGEVVKILRKDGEPVGYGDALIAILPSFPGIKKLLLPA